MTDTPKLHTHSFGACECGTTISGLLDTCADSMREQAKEIGRLSGLLAAAQETIQQLSDGLSVVTAQRNAAQERLVEAEQRREETVAMCEQLRGELAEAQRKLSCGHPAEFDDSYGGCVFCTYKEGCLELERENKALEGEFDALKERLAEVGPLLKSVGSNSVEALVEGYRARVAELNDVLRKGDALRTRHAECVEALKLNLAIVTKAWTDYNWPLPSSAFGPDGAIAKGRAALAAQEQSE